MGKNSRLGDSIRLEHLVHGSAVRSALDRFWNRSLNRDRLALLLDECSFGNIGAFGSRSWLPIVITFGVHKRFARRYSSYCSLLTLTSRGNCLLRLWSVARRRATLDTSDLRQLVVAVKLWVVETPCVSEKGTKGVSLKFVSYNRNKADLQSLRLTFQ